MKLLTTMIFLAMTMFAADFGHMSTEEMMQMRGNVPAEEQAEFRDEMQKRMQHMTPEERQRYQNERPGMGQNMMGGQGMMNGQQQMQTRPGMQEIPAECRKYTMGNPNMMNNQGMMNNQQGMQGNQHMMQQDMGQQAMQNMPKQCRKYMDGSQNRMMDGQGTQQGMPLNRQNMHEGMKCGSGM